MPLPAPPQKYLRNRPLSKYIGVSEMTLRRWKANPRLKTPKAMIVNGISYNDLAAWDRWLRKRAVSRAEEAAA